MYQYQEALALPRGASQGWIASDLGSQSCQLIAHQYSEAYISLTHPILEEPQVLLLSAVAPQISGLTITFNEWLVQNGNKTLPTTPGNFELKEGFAEAMDAVYAGYRITATDASMHPDSPQTIEQRTDLLLQRKNVDYTKMHKHVLATVNGLFHRTGVSQHGFMVYDGGRSANRAKQNNVGLLNFQYVSGFQCHTIEPSWFRKPLPLLGYKDRFYLQTSVSLRGKSVALVVAGFLILPGDELKKVNDNTLSVAWNRLSMFDRYCVADQLLDLREHVKLEILRPEDGRRLTEELCSDDFVVQMCTLPQSFLIVFDEPSLAVEREQLEALHVPGRWLLHRRPQGLVQVDLGVAPEYTVSAQRGNQYVIQTRPQYQRKPIDSTVRRNVQLVQDNSYHGAFEYRIAQGHLVSFSSERVVITPPIA